MSSESMHDSHLRWGGLPDMGFGDGSVNRLSETSSVLTDKSSGFSVQVIGTAHLSRDSVDEVREAFEQMRPACVALDLCRKRRVRLLGQLSRAKSWAAEDFGREPTVEEIHAEADRGLRDVLRVLLGGANGTRRTLTAEVLGASLDGMHGVLRLWGFAPGQGFVVAMEEASSMGVNVELMDRDVENTLERMAELLHEGSLSALIKSLLGTAKNDPFLLPSALLRGIAKSAALSERGNFGTGTGLLHPSTSEIGRLLLDTIERVKTRSAAVAATEVMDTLFPDLNNVILHERDEIMARHLATVTRPASFSAKLGTPGSALAVVGIGHLPGIEAWWERGTRRFRVSQEGHAH